LGNEDALIFGIGINIYKYNNGFTE
jgi:hypothetical protein